MAEGTIFSLDEFKKYKKRWNARVKELSYRASYYDGSVYSNMKDLIWSLGPRVGKEIKPMFLPLSRAVDIDSGIIGGDWAFPPADTEPKADNWDAARDLLFDWSSWDTQGVLFVHYGAQYGVTGIRVADMEDKVTITPVDPTKFLLIYDGLYGSVPSAAIWVEDMIGEDGERYEYAEYITPETVRTFKNGKSFGYDGMEPEYPNTIGVIPIFEALHINDGTEWGACTYEKSIPLLNEVNELATRLSRVIEQNVTPQAVISGAEPSELTRSGDVMWFLPGESSAQFLTPTVDIPGVLEFIREIKEGVKESLPELSFDDIRKNGQVATATLEIQLQELVIKIKRVRPNYDRCLTSALQLAGSLSPQLSALNDEELILDPYRAVLPQNQMDKIALRMQEIELERMEGGNDEGVNA